MSAVRLGLMVAGGAAIVALSFAATTLLMDWLAASAQSINPATAISAIVIQTATYGGNCNAPLGNATAKLRAVCGGKANCNYTVDAGKLGDPAPGCPKGFFVRYTCANSAAKGASLPAEASGKSLRLSCP